MLPLLETVIGFVAIMLVLSFLVKSLTSLIKNQFDFYTRNLKHEVNRLVRGTLDKTFDQLRRDPVARQRAPWIADINWERLGDAFLTAANMKWVLKELGASDDDLKDLEGRVQVHLANVKYAFEMRMKNLSLVVGLALCLVLNINAFSIWRTLYSDQQLRSTFAGPYADAAAKLTAVGEKQGDEKKPPARQPPAKKSPSKSLNPAQAPPPSSPGTRSKAPDGVASADEPWAASAPAGEADDAEKRKKQLKEQTEAIKTQLSQFQTDVRFGTGKLWRIKVVPEKPGDRQSEEIARNGRWVFFIWEFLGSLLTGILVSIGAPYWHDLLQALSALRSPKAVK